jgi:hypothetical protein
MCRVERLGRGVRGPLGRAQSGVPVVPGAPSGQWWSGKARASMEIVSAGARWLAGRAAAKRWGTRSSRRSRTCWAAGAPSVTPRAYSVVRLRLRRVTPGWAQSQPARVSAVRSGQRSSGRSRSKSTSRVPLVRPRGMAQSSTPRMVGVALGGAGRWRTRRSRGSGLVSTGSVAPNRSPGKPKWRQRYGQTDGALCRWSSHR